VIERISIDYHGMIKSNIYKLWMSIMTNKNIIHFFHLIVYLNRFHKAECPRSSIVNIRRLSMRIWYRPAWSHFEPARGIVKSTADSQCYMFKAKQSFQWWWLTFAKYLSGWTWNDCRRKLSLSELFFINDWIKYNTLVLSLYHA